MKLTKTQTEWCYNYHGEVPHACNTKFYPTPEEQNRFIRAYLTHNPSYRAQPGAPSTPSTPHLGPLPTSGSTTALAATAAPSSISAFMLDSRAPPGEKYSYHDQEAQAEQRTQHEAERLMAETRLWRLANSAQWTAWGIVQANIPGLPDFDKEQLREDETEQSRLLDSATFEMKAEADKERQESHHSATGAGDGDAEQPKPEDEEFDYLAYAQERAMFVWGDAIQLGIVKAEELPEELRSRVKVVEC
jgi:choline kinase